MPWNIKYNLLYRTNFHLLFLFPVLLVPIWIVPKDGRAWNKNHLSLMVFQWLGKYSEEPFQPSGYSRRYISKRTLGTYYHITICLQPNINIIHKSFLQQGCTNFPKIYEISQNCWHQKGHKKQVYNCDQITFIKRTVKNSVLTVTNKLHNF